MQVADSGSFKFVGFSDLSKVFLAEMTKYLVITQVDCRMEQRKMVTLSGKSETHPVLLFIWKNSIMVWQNVLARPGQLFYEI